MGQGVLWNKLQLRWGSWEAFEKALAERFPNEERNAPVEIKTFTDMEELIARFKEASESCKEWTIWDMTWDFMHMLPTSHNKLRRKFKRDPPEDLQQLCERARRFEDTLAEEMADM